MEQGYLFVDSAQIDKTARQRIRRHVMNGKNAGKKVYRRSRLSLAQSTTYHQKQHYFQQDISQHIEMQLTRVEQKPISPVQSHRLFGNVFRTLSYPAQPTSYTIDVFNQFFSHVVNRFYPCRLGISADDAKYWWLQFALSDAAAYHIVIAVAEACNQFLEDGGDSSPKALYHQHRALKLVAERLASNEALSESTVGVIVMMIVQVQMRKAVPEAHIHYEGLRRLVDARGGLDQLEQSPMVLLKVCKMDHLYAWQHGGRMTYFRDRMPYARALLKAEGFSFDRSLAESAVKHRNLNSQLYHILLDVTNLSILLNNMPPNTRLGYLTFAEVVHSICYRLSRFQPLQEPSSLSDIESVYHIGLTIFMITLFMQFDPQQRLLKCDAVLVRLRSVLFHDLGEIDDGLMLWLLFMGGMWMTHGPDDVWLYSKIKNTASSMGIGTWVGIYSVINGFPWIDNLHTEPCVALWESVCESR